MPTLRHPSFADVTVDVDDEAAERWQMAGWLADEPEPTPVDPSPAGRGSNTTRIGLGRVSERDAR